MLKKFSFLALALLVFGAGCQQPIGNEWDTRTAPDGTQWEVHDETGKLKSVLDEEQKTVDGEPVFGAGFAPVTGYQTQTTARVSASATTIPVASVTDKAGNLIVPSLISSSSTVRMYFNFEAGTTREEPFLCTGISGLNLTGCVRGLSFQGADLTGSSTIAQVHNAGSSIIMTNLGVMYGNEFVGTSGDQTVFDTKTFNTLPRATSTTAAPTNNAELVTKYYADTLVSAGFSCSSVDQTRGIECSGAPATFGINLSTTSSGLLFSGGQLKVSASSTGGIDINGIGNLFLDTSDALSWSGNQTFNGSVFVNTPTIAGEAAPKSYVDGQIAAIFGDGSDGALLVTTTTTLTTDRIYQYTSITVATGATLTVGGSAEFKPLTLLSQSDIIVAGTINLKGKGNPGGPGGTSSGAPQAGSFGNGINGSGAGGGGGGGRGSGAGQVGGNATNTQAGTGGAGGGGGSGQAGGTGGNSLGSPFASSSLDLVKGGLRPWGLGGGGGGGGWSNLVSGGGGDNGSAGAYGGGALILGANGNIIVGSSGSINVGGGDGVSDTVANNPVGGSAPGGGGTFLGIHNGSYVNNGYVYAGSGAVGVGRTTGSGTGATSGLGASGTILTVPFGIFN